MEPKFRRDAAAVRALQRKRSEEQPYLSSPRAVADFALYNHNGSDGSTTISTTGTTQTITIGHASFYFFLNAITLVAAGNALTFSWEKDSVDLGVSTPYLTKFASVANAGDYAVTITPAVGTPVTIHTILNIT